MKTNTFSIALVLVFISLSVSERYGPSSQVSYGWTKRMGGRLMEHGNDITTDSSGNVYIAGFFQETVDFGLDFGTTDIKGSDGFGDIFVTKISPNGIYRWTRRMGGIEDDIGRSIATDSLGNVYLTGDFEDTVDFGLDFGTTDIKTATGKCYDIFVTKINPNGTYGWTKIMGGTDCDEGSDIATDSWGNIYLTGSFSGAVDFGSGFGTTDIKTSRGKAVFVTKINANATYGWTKIMGGTAGVDEGHSIATDSSGNVYITGDFDGTEDFGLDFGTTDVKTSWGWWNIFVTKINSNGTYGWTKRMGGGPQSTDSGFGITTDSSGNVYITGWFEDIVNFGLDFGTTDIKTAGYWMNIFVTKITPNGTYGWTRGIGGEAMDIGRDITTDSSGNVYVTGEFMGTVNFGLDFGTTDIKTSRGGQDIFITRIDSNGTYGWTKRTGGADISDAGSGITTDSAGNVYITGDFYGAADFGLDFGATDYKTSKGISDVFITKLQSELQDPDFTNPEFNYTTVNKITARPGQAITFTIHFMNTGGKATGVVISDGVDSNLDSVQPLDGGSLSGRTITWDLGAVGVDKSGSVRFTAKVKAGVPPGIKIFNSASIDSAETSPASTNAAVVTVVY